MAVRLYRCISLHTHGRALISGRLIAIIVMFDFIFEMFRL